MTSADEVERLRLELETTRRMLEQSEAERERIWAIVEDYRKANSARAAEIASARAD